MTIDLKTLKCGECGGSALKRTGLNEFSCGHCGSVTITEDDVSQRLERVLEQVKDEAGRRLAAEQSARNRTVGKNTVIGMGIAVAAVAVIAGFSAFMASRQQAARSGGPAPVVASLANRAIPVTDLQLDTPREVLAGTGSSARPKLLVMVRNDGDQPLERPMVKATFYDGASRIAEHGGNLPIGLLAPGESAPLLIDLPGGQVTATRQELAVQRLAAPHRSTDGPRLAFSRVRLVQQKDDLRLVGRLANTRPGGALAGSEVLVTLYDERGAVIGYGHGYTQANEIAPGERSDVEVRIERLGAAPVAAWDYRIGYQLKDGNSGGRTHVVARDRVIRSTTPPEAFHPDLRLASAELLADDSERFDTAQLELLPLVPARGITQRPMYLGEVVNRSADTVVLAPGAVISRYDGNKLDGSNALAAPAYLYPGERFPLLLEPRQSNRITETRLEWKPVMRRAALPGPRVPLEITVSDTRADTSNVLVNFSQRFTYRFAKVSGSVKNPGNAIVRKARLWVSLRDREGRLTGFTAVDNLPAIGPGESAPFEVKVDQLGRDFATVSTLYQTE